MRQFFAALARAFRVVAGAPRYDAYRAHLARHHPDREPMSRAEFERARLDDRYSKPGARCC
ncbi:MAG TPA: YbdD/YjiX family protein [Gemmatimonadaceae bacterium]|nr:YbdD/YjiX family protein [Gemmatimonadaceae bacterium]